MSILCLLPAAFSLFLAAQPRPAVPVDGEPFDAQLVAADAQWLLTFSADGRRRTLPATDLVRWGSPAEIVPGPLAFVATADGGLLAADVLEADPEKLKADADLFGPVELPLDRVAAIVFRLPAERHTRDLLFDQVRVGEEGHHGEALAGDRVILVNGDSVGGRFRRFHENKLEMETDVGPLEIELDRVRALVLNPALLRPARHEGLYAIAGFDDGSRLVADRLVIEGSTLSITTAGGLVWQTARDELVSLRPMGGRATYLSDLEPSGTRQLPFLDLSWPPVRNDRNITGGLLRCGGELYLKGLGVHSADRLTYQWSEPYRRFEARLGIDDSTAGQGSVRFHVYVDGKEQYTSSIVCGGDEPVPVSVDVAGAKRLDLIVDYADRADVEDHADWLDARLVR